MGVNPKKYLSSALHGGRQLLASAGFSAAGTVLRDVVKLKQQLNQLRLELERLRNDHSIEEKRLETDREIRLAALDAARWALEEGIRRNNRKLYRDALSTLEELGRSPE